jgi:hypothetical protein
LFNSTANKISPVYDCGSHSGKVYVGWKLLTARKLCLPYNFQALLWSIQSFIYNTWGLRGVGWGELIMQGVVERQQTLPSVVKVENAYSFPFTPVSHTVVWCVYRNENYSSAEGAEGVRLLGRR